MMQSKEEMRDHCRFVVDGMRNDRSEFRPSDWIERISSQIAQDGEAKKLGYHHHVHPRVIDGEKYLIIERSMEEKDPLAFTFVLEFCRANELRIREECMRVER